MKIRDNECETGDIKYEDTMLGGRNLYFCSLD